MSKQFTGNGLQNCKLNPYPLLIATNCNFGFLVYCEVDSSGQNCIMFWNTYKECHLPASDASDRVAQPCLLLNPSISGNIHLFIPNGDACLLYFNSLFLLVFLKYWIFKYEHGWPEKSFFFGTIIKNDLVSKIACCRPHFGKLQGALHIFYLQILLHHRTIREYVTGPVTSSLI